MHHCDWVIRVSILHFCLMESLIEKNNCFSHLKGTDKFIKLNEEKTEIIVCDHQTYTCPYQHDHLDLFILLSQRTFSLREALQPTQMTLISRELKTIKMSLLVTYYHE